MLGRLRVFQFFLIVAIRTFYIILPIPLFSIHPPAIFYLMILQPVAGLIPEEEIALQLVFHDEAQHATLAWRTIHWALQEDGNVEKLLQRALENLKLRRLRRKNSFCKVTFNYVIMYIGIYFYMIYIYIYS